MVHDLMSASGQVLPENLRALLLTGGMNVLAAVLILIAGWTVASWLSRGAGRALNRTRHVDETLKPITVSLVRYGVLVVTVLAVLRRFGVETTSLIAVIGAAGLAIGLAMQGTLSNVAAGVMLLFLRPFRIGDYIEAAGQGGTVREIGLFTTILLSADLVYISVPNAQIFGGTIINYTREPTRRINFTVGIDYADDIAAAQKIVLGVLESDPRVLKTPKPLAPVGGLGASSVEIVVRCWVPNTVYWDTLFDLHKAVKLALNAGGITIPFQQHMVSFRNGSAPGSDIKN